jgi:hypothetical protein
VQDLQAAKADEFELSENYPNPFNQTTCINFSVPKPVQIAISIYNFNGQLAECLMDESIQPGDHQIVWDAAGQASGVYVICLKAGEVQRTRKCLLVK